MSDKNFVIKKKKSLEPIISVDIMSPYLDIAEQLKVSQHLILWHYIVLCKYENLELIM